MTASDLISASQSVLIIVDIQEKLAPAIDGNKALINRTITLIQAAKKLRVPIIFTEHYPQGLGPTLSAIKAIAPHSIGFEKIHFDACREPHGIIEHIQSLQRSQLILVGCEAHVCLMQTAFGLDAAGFDVRIVGDAIGSRRAEDKKAAIHRMTARGIGLVTSEMLIFEWLECCDHPAFKDVLKMIKA